MTTLTKEKTTIETLFNNAPEDIQNMIYTKIMYPQPKELLQEIRTRSVIYSILCSLEREKDLKPTLNNVAISLYELPENTRAIILNKIGE
tara:strand:- start:3589 stop:3858 length:270 start_codon:yes stop_codon:yes gene_type:complete